MQGPSPGDEPRKVVSDRVQLVRGLPHRTSSRLRGSAEIVEALISLDHLVAHLSQVCKVSRGNPAPHEIAGDSRPTQAPATCLMKELSKELLSDGGDG
jgi:hypothetical protein